MRWHQEKGSTSLANIKDTDPRTPPPPRRIQETPKSKWHIPQHPLVIKKKKHTLAPLLYRRRHNTNPSSSISPTTHTSHHVMHKIPPPLATHPTNPNTSPSPLPAFPSHPPNANIRPERKRQTSTTTVLAHSSQPSLRHG